MVSGLVGTVLKSASPSYFGLSEEVDNHGLKLVWRDRAEGGHVYFTPSSIVGILDVGRVNVRDRDAGSLLEIPKEDGEELIVLDLGKRRALIVAARSLQGVLDFLRVTCDDRHGKEPSPAPIFRGPG